MTKLLQAIRTGTVAEVRELLLKDSRVLAQGGSWRPDGRHPDGGAGLLWEALHSSRDRDEKLRALILAGADVNTTSLPKGTTLLNHALLEGDVSLAGLLLSLDADVAKRDRRGLLPVAIAKLRDDFVAAGILLAAGAPDAEALVGDAEQAFLLERPLFAEIHETLKWAARGAGFEVSRMQIPAPWTADAGIAVLYWISAPGTCSWRLRLGVERNEDAWSLSLTLEDASSGEPVADLLPPGESVSNSILRGHLVTMLRGARSPGSFAPPPSSGQRAAPPEGSAWALLGVAAGSSRAEITRAYRKLAKTYHPDRAGAAGELKMKEVNRAYEEVAKKRK